MTHFYVLQKGIGPTPCFHGGYGHPIAGPREIFLVTLHFISSYMKTQRNFFLILRDTWIMTGETCGTHSFLFPLSLDRCVNSPTCLMSALKIR